MVERSETHQKSRLGGRLFLWIVGPLLVIVIGAIAFIRNPPDALLLDALASQLRQQTGYQLSYGSVSSVQLWPQTRIDLQNVRIRRPALNTASGGILAEAKRITADISIKNLLSGGRTIKNVHLDEPTVTLHKADLRRFRSQSDTDSSAFVLHDMVITNGYLSYYESSANPTVAISEFQATVKNASASRIEQLKGQFRWRDARVEIDAAMARTGSGRSDLTLALKAPLAKATLQGVVSTDPATRFEGNADVRITALSDFARWLDVDLGPDNPSLSHPTTITGPIAISKKQIWLKGSNVATSIADGKVDIALDLSGARPRITGEAVWERLDLSAFTSANFNHGVPPSTSSSAEVPASIPSAWDGLNEYLEELNDPSSSRNIAPRAVTSSSIPPLPAKSSLASPAFDFSVMSSVDADLSQTSREVLIAGLVLKDVSADSRLNAGKLKLDVRQATFAGGRWTAKLDVDGRAPTPEHALAVTGRRVDAKLLQQLTLGQTHVEGRSNFTANVSARGGSFDTVVQSLSGKAQLALAEGRLIGFDLRAVLNQWWRKWTYNPKRVTPFAKVNARLRLRNGVLNTVVPITLTGQYVEIDTSGSISLTRKRLNQRLRARLAPPPSQLPIPVRISGPWSAPLFKLDFGLFSLKPRNYELPFGTETAPARRSIAPSASQLSVDQMPAGLRSKIEEALENPAKASKMPAKLREMLTRLVR